LYKEFVKERKELLKKSNKNNKKKKKKNSLSGFAIPSKITKELADFLGLDENIEIPRTDVTKLICKYIKDNNLQNPENKKIIIPDEKFKKLFEGQLDENNKLEFFNIQTYLKCHFIKSKPNE
jgi:chromatin remodeling complex protein RSC6